MGHTLARYVGLSVLAASAVVYHAFATRQHFYRAAIYLSSSKIAVAAIGNLAFALALCTHQLVIKLFLGSLRDIEQEMIRERLSSAVMESLLALTIFREEFSTFFVAMFASLVFIKVMHWLVQDRVDYVEVTPTISLLGHLRIVSFMALLLALDSAFLQYTIAGTIQSSGQSVMLLFAFEYVILASTIVRYALKYGMSMVDLAMDGNWTGKGAAVFYLELISDLLHLFVYVSFFTIVFMHYGLPLHLVRDLYSTFRNFRSRMHDFLRFRQVTARLDRFPDASADDLRRCDGVCIICREEMTEAGSNKRLFCGHVFHLHCLRSWLERQQNCPTCRASVFRRPAAGQQQAAGAEPAAAAGAVADGGDAARRHPHDAAAGHDGAVLRPPVEPHAAAAAAAGSLRHRRVGNGNSAGAGTSTAAAPAAAPEASSSAGPSRSSSQPLAAAEARPVSASASRSSLFAAPSAAGVSQAPAAASGNGGPGPSAPAAAAAPTSAAVNAQAAGFGAGCNTAGAGTTATPRETILHSALESLRAEHQRLVHRLIVKRRQQAQQRSSGVSAVLIDQWVAAAFGELHQIRARIHQIEAALADILRPDSAVDSEAGLGSGAAGAVGLPPHFVAPTLLPLAPFGGAVPTAAAATAAGSIPGNAAAAFPTPWPLAPHVPLATGAFPGMPPFLGLVQPMMIPVVPVALPAGTATTAAAVSNSAAAGSGPALAAVQVPLSHHQLAAAAAAAAASAAAAGMLGTGLFTNGGGMFFVPQPLQQQQAQPAAAAATAEAGPGAFGGGTGDAERASAAPDAAPAAAGAAPVSDAEREAAAASSASGAAGAAAAAESKERQSEAASGGVLQGSAPVTAVVAQPLGDDTPAAPAVVTSAADGGAAPGTVAGTEEDPQEAMRRIRLQRFGQ